MRLTSFLPAVALMIVMTAPGALAEDMKLIIHACNFEPYYGETMDEGGPVAKITRLAFLEVGYDVDIRFVPWARAMVDAESGNCDILLGLWYSRERETFVSFTNSILINEIGLFKKKSDDIVFKDFKNLKDAKVTIGGVRGYVNPAGFREAGLVIDEASDDILNMRKLLFGRVRLAISDKNVGWYVVKKEYPQKVEEIEWLTTLDSFIMLNGVSKKSNKNWMKITADFNKGLDIIKKNGIVSEIFREYFLR